jgi:hypothetical protein
MAHLVNFPGSVERWGLFHAIYHGIMRRLRTRLAVCRVHVRPLSSASTSPEPIEGITVRVATHSELLRGAEQMPDQLDAESIAAALGRGDLCVAAFEGCRMVAFVWRSFSTAPYSDGLWVAFEKPYRYGYKAFTRPEYRGRRLQNPIALLTDELCVERGHGYAIGVVDTHNYPSIASDASRGNRLVGFAGYVKVFGRAYPFRSFGARKHRFRFYRRSAA